MTGLNERVKKWMEGLDWDCEQLQMNPRVSRFTKRNGRKMLVDEVSQKAATQLYLDREIAVAEAELSGMALGWNCREALHGGRIYNKKVRELENEIKKLKEEQ